MEGIKATESNGGSVVTLEKVKMSKLDKLRAALKSLFTGGPTITPISKQQAMRMQYPKTGTGKRQGERLARQRAKGLLDFSASEKCLARIAERRSA